MAKHIQPPQRRRSSIKKEFGEKELQDLRTAFKLIDANSDGRVNVDEFKSMLRNLDIVIPDEKVQELIRGASHTGNELLDENDFLSWVKKIQDLRPDDKEKSTEDDSRELIEAFRVFDLDSNGYITRDELRRGMEMIGEPLTETQLSDLICAADVDKDGKINYEEFARMLR